MLRTRRRISDSESPVEPATSTMSTTWEPAPAWTPVVLPGGGWLDRLAPPPDVGALDAERAHLLGRISTTEGALDAARGQLVAARTELEGARAALGGRPDPGPEAPPEERAAYEGWLAGARAAVVAAEGRVAALEGEVTRLTGELSSLRSRLASVEARRDEALARPEAQPEPWWAASPDPLLAQVAPTSETPATPPIEEGPCVELPEGRREELEDKATRLGRVLNQTPDADALQEVVKDLRSPSEVDELIRAYNEHHQVAPPGQTPPPPLTKEALLRKAALMLPDPKSYALFEARLGGDPKTVARETLRLATNDFSLSELGEQDARFARQRGMLPSDPTAPWFASPLNPVGWAAYEVYKGVTRLPTEVNRLVAVDADQAQITDALDRLTPAERQAFFADPENRALLDRAKAAMTSESDRIRFAAFERTGERRDATVEEVERDRPDLSPEQVEAEVDRRVEARTDADLAAADLVDARTDTKVWGDLTKVQAALDRARTDPEFKKELVETYAASRGPVFDADGRQLSPMEVLERDVVEAASHSLATQVYTTPSTPGPQRPVEWAFKELVLSGDAERSRRNADVAKTTVQQLMLDDRFATTGEKLNEVPRALGGKNLDATAVKLLVFEARTNPDVAKGLERMGLTVEQVEAYAEHLSRAEASNRAARLTNAAFDGNLTKKGGLLDGLENASLTNARRRWEEDREAYDPASDPDRSRWKALQAKKDFLDGLQVEQNGLLDEEMTRRHGVGTLAFVEQKGPSDPMVRSALSDAFTKGAVSEDQELFLSLWDKNAARVKSLYAGRTKPEIDELERRYASRYDNDLEYSLDNLLGTNGWTTERPADRHGLGASDLVVIQAMRKGDPKAVYDPENPPSDPEERREAATLRRKLEEDVATARYRDARPGGVVPWLLDGYETATREQASNDLVDGNQRRLDDFRRQNAAALDAGDPRAWAEYQELDRRVVADLQTRHDYEDRVVRTVTFVLEVVGATTATVATAGGASSSWLVVIAAATELSKAMAEAAIRPEGLSSTEASQKLVAIVIDSALAMGGEVLKSLASAKNATKTVTALNKFVNDLGGLDAAKTVAKQIADKGLSNDKAWNDLKNAVGADVALALVKSMAGGRVEQALEDRKLPAPELEAKKNAPGLTIDLAKNQRQANVDERQKKVDDDEAQRQQDELVAKRATRR